MVTHPGSQALEVLGGNDDGVGAGLGVGHVGGREHDLGQEGLAGGPVPVRGLPRHSGRGAERGVGQLAWARPLRMIDSLP
jgi:hypothetical protein